MTFLLLHCDGHGRPLVAKDTRGIPMGDHGNPTGDHGIPLVARRMAMVMPWDDTDAHDFPMGDHGITKGDHDIPMVARGMVMDDDGMPRTSMGCHGRPWHSHG